jgi:hypothetical protein
VRQLVLQQVMLVQVQVLVQVLVQELQLLELVLHLN